MKRMVKILTCFLAVLLLAGCAQTPKRIHHGSALFRGYNLHEAVDESTYIVYGKVVSKGRPKEVTTGYDMEGNPAMTGCCRRVTLEVIDCAKGGLEAGDTVSYCEMGGETRDAIYLYDYTIEVAEGENVLVFLYVDEDEIFAEICPYVLSPAWIWILEDMDDLVGIEKKNLPEAMASKVTKTEGYNEVADVSFMSLFEAARQMAEGTYVETMDEIESEIDGEIEGEYESEPEGETDEEPDEEPDEEIEGEPDEESEGDIEGEPEDEIIGEIDGDPVGETDGEVSDEVE